MSLALPTLAALGALAAVQAVWAGERPRRFLLLKPLATALFLAWALGGYLDTLLGGAGPRAAWLGAGLALGLLGDVCLLGRGSRAFLAGLGSFLFAHLAFIAAFLSAVPLGFPPAWTWILLPVAAAFLAWLLPATRRLRGPVLAYALALLAMVLAAARAFALRGGPAEGLALGGALCFLLSDALLATDRFRGPLRRGQPLVLATYWIAVGLLAASARAA